MNIESALHTLERRLVSFSDEARWESYVILEEATGLLRPVIFTHPEREIEEQAWRQAESMVERRLSGEPLPYILGSWGFYGRSFRVTPDVLIPRPETELLVERALLWLKRNPHVRTMTDVGCGSGCIGLTLLCECPTLQCTALDLSEKALRIASENALSLGCFSRWRGCLSNLTFALRTLPPLICANLPYIPTETCKELDVAKHEPLLALDGGADGFELYRLLFSDLRHKMDEVLNRNTLILCEIEYRQREIALESAEAFFPEASRHVLNDLAGQPRLLEIEVGKNE